MSNMNCFVFFNPKRFVLCSVFCVTNNTFEKMGNQVKMLTDGHSFGHCALETNKEDTRMEHTSKAETEVAVLVCTKDFFAQCDKVRTLVSYLCFWCNLDFCMAFVLV